MKVDHDDHDHGDEGDDHDDHDHGDEGDDHDDHGNETEDHDGEHHLGHVTIHIEAEGDYGFALPEDVEFHVVMEKEDMTTTGHGSSHSSGQVCSR